jgi:hypothetical protein
MAKRNRYDDKFRASAVVMLEAAGYPNEKGALTRISEHLHVPKTTISRWFTEKNNPAPPELVTEKRGELTDWIKSEVAAIFDRMPVVRDEASYRDLATAAGIFTDKLQLLSGKPTERTEHVNRTAEERADRAAELLDAARTRRDGQSAMDRLQ